MAEDLLAHLPDPTPEAAAANPTGNNQAPLSPFQRVIVQNFFDTQPKKRQAYLAQLGYEMNPKDTNEYRPMGSQTGYAKVDPGFIDAYKQGNLAGGLNELGFKVSQNLFEGAVKMALVGAGGAAGQGLLPIPGVGAILGGVAGGALGNAGAEALKNSIGDLLLDKSIPQDHKLTAIQSLITGATPEIFKLGTNVTGSAIEKIMSSRAQSIVNAAKAAGGLSQGLAEKAASNPEMFSEEAVQGATKKLSDQYKSIFGVDENSAITPRSTRDLNPNSLFGKAVNPLNDQATLAQKTLDKNPEANWSVGEITQPLKRMVDSLESSFDKSYEQKAGLSYLKDKISEIEDGASSYADKIRKTTGAAQGLSMDDILKKTPARVDIDGIELPYSAGRSVLKSMQADAFDREVPGSGFLKQAVGGDPNGLRAIADAKISQLAEKAAKSGATPEMLAEQGLNLPNINAQRSNILNLFNEAKSTITPTKMTSAYLGADNIAKNQTRDVLTKMDQTLGTNLSADIDNGGLQRQMENVYSNRGNFGSGRANQAALMGGLEGAIKGATAGGGLGMLSGHFGPTSPAIGAVVGGVRGAANAAALSSPEAAIQAITRAKAGQAYGQSVADAAVSPLSRAASVAAGSTLSNPTGLPDNDDPLSHLPDPE